MAVVVPVLLELLDSGGNGGPGGNGVHPFPTTFETSKHLISLVFRLAPGGSHYVGGGGGGAIN